VTQSLGEGSDSDDDEKLTWKLHMGRRKNELFSLAKHVEEDETDSAQNDDESPTLSGGRIKSFFTQNQKQ
jgi:hypothetical protein